MRGITRATIYLSDGDYVILVEEGRGGSATGYSTPRDRIVNKLQECQRQGGRFFSNDKWIPFHSIVRVEFRDEPDHHVSI